MMRPMYEGGGKTLKPKNKKLAAMYGLQNYKITSR